ncbi:hypothetical protein GCM10025865_10730 [Paraoerskovia sediminicola]|uniref:alcohol dehydrogenase (NADP(+)) n=1 Tax=Paraoerskovia sediminicola TaxID=1138587 RepID=A0ABM8G134_9CELL|nr:hypothetical protein GCM10025865_10730 [Paraoerskovia sediminicola]
MTFLTPRVATSAPPRLPAYARRMTTTVPALAAPTPGAPFERTTVVRRDLGTHDVLIDIAYAGICHSDIHQAREEWGKGIFPMVPGHEITGTVAAVGPEVTHHLVGDRVGVGCFVDSCRECDACLHGEEQFCEKGAVMTYNGRQYSGEETYGGYSTQIVVDERYVLHIPDGLGLDVAAPLLCAGITTYSPLRRWGPGSTSTSPSSAWADWATSRSRSRTRWAPRSRCSATPSPSRRTASASAPTTTSRPPTRPSSRTSARAST